MDVIQNIWDKTKKVAKFVGRHFFTLVILFLSIGILIFASLNWKNALIYLGIAIAIDWMKQFGKCTLNGRLHHSHSNSHAISRRTLDDENPYILGTSAYLRRDNYYH